MKFYLAAFIVAIVACSDYMDGTMCSMGSECVSGCCGYYKYDMTEMGMSYMNEMSMMSDSMMMDSMMSDSMMMDSMMDKTMMCVSDSKADMMDNSYYDYYKMCSYASQIVVSTFVAVLAIY